MNKNKWLTVVTLTSLAGLVLSCPQAALAASGAPWEVPLQQALDFMTGTTGQIIATLGIMGVGVTFLMGRLNLVLAGTITIGIAVIFGAANIVTMLH